MALITRIIVFLLSLLFIIVLLGATTSFADEFKGEVTNENYRLYTVEWIYEKNEEGRATTCGTTLRTYDYGGRTIILDYYLILLNNKIVSQLRMDAVQVSMEDFENFKSDKFNITIHAGKISKDGKDMFGGTRLEDSKLKGLRVQFNTFNPEQDIKDIITLYEGGYDIYFSVFPSLHIRIPVIKNPLYAPIKEGELRTCIDDLIKYKKYQNSQGGEILPEQSHNVG